jgi:hypothetical protein
MDDEIAHLLKMRAAYEQSLRANREKKAAYGIDAPSHLAIEIAQAEKGIRLVDAQLGMVQAPQDIIEAIGPQDAGTMLVEYRVKLLDKKVGDALLQISEKVGEVSDQVVRVVDQVARIDVVTEQRYVQEQAVRKDRQQEHDERTTDIEAGLMELREQLRAFTKQIDKRWWVDAVLITGMITAILLWLLWR